MALINSQRSGMWNEIGTSGTWAGGVAPVASAHICAGHMVLLQNQTSAALTSSITTSAGGFVAVKGTGIFKYRGAALNFCSVSTAEEVTSGHTIPRGNY